MRVRDCGSGALFFFQAEDGIRDKLVTGVQTCALPISLMHIIAAKAVCFREALQPSFRDYARLVVANAKVLAETLAGEGFRIISGGTRSEERRVGKECRSRWSPYH